MIMMMVVVGDGDVVVMMKTSIGKVEARTRRARVPSAPPDILAANIPGLWQAVGLDTKRRAPGKRTTRQPLKQCAPSGFGGREQGVRGGVGQQLGQDLPNQTRRHTGCRPQGT